MILLLMLEPLPRVVYARRSIGDVDTCAKGSSNHSGHVDGESVTCQDSCGEGSSNHSDYWKRVMSFGTASTYSIVPGDFSPINRRKPCSNKKRRTRKTRRCNDKANHKYKSNGQIPTENISYNKQNGCLPHSTIFDHDEFQKLNYLDGPFTLHEFALAYDV